MEEKIELSVGCVEWMQKEIEQLRRQNELLSAKQSVVDSFFSMVDRLGEKQRVGYGEDRLWQAKKEIEAAKFKRAGTLP